MKLYAGQIETSTYEELAKEFEISLLTSELDILTLSSEIANNNYSVMLFQNPNLGTMSTYLINPCKAFIELESQNNKNRDVIANLNEPNGIYFSFLSKTIFNIPIAHIIEKALYRKLNFRDFVRDKFVSSLHEALLEIMTNGCFEMEENISTLTGFDNYLNTLKDHSTNPDYANKRINLTIDWDDKQISFKLSHEGRPCYFDKTKIKASNFSPSLQRLQIIEDCADKKEVAQDGHQLKITINR